MSINAKMTAIADEIRTLSGTTGTMGLDRMAEHVGDANEEIGNQEELLQQIASALEGKAGGGESSVPVLQSKTVAPTTSSQTVTADEGYDGLDKVTVEAIPTTKLATPSATMLTNGTIRAQVTQTNGGYVESGSSVASETRIRTVGAQTITPGTSEQTIDRYVYLTGVQTIKGDPNLVAANIKSGVSIFGVNGTLEEGSGSGGGSEVVEYSENEDAIINRTITSYMNDRVKTIGSYAFYSCSRLTTASFPACTSIGNYAFYYCHNLATAYFPACTDIGVNAFSGCRSLTTVSFPACTNIGNNAFTYCSHLTTASFPACTSIGSSAFSYCYSLTTASFPACTSIGSSAFYSCYSLTTVSFPVCTSIGNNAFYSCSSLTIASFPVCTSIGNSAFCDCRSLATASFPACTSIGSSAFSGCYSLTTVSFPVCTSIGNSAFARCRTLSSLTLGASTVCTLSNSGAFSSTPYAGYSSYFSGTPWIYVPASLIDAYKTATNWVYFSSYFSAIDVAEEMN